MAYGPAKLVQNKRKNGQKVSLQVNPNQYYGIKGHSLSFFKLAVSMSVDKNYSNLGFQIKDFFEKQYDKKNVLLQDHSDDNANYFLIYFKDLTSLNSSFKALFNGLKIISFVKKEQMSVNDVEQSAREILEDIE